VCGGGSEPEDKEGAGPEASDDAEGAGEKAAADTAAPVQDMAKVQALYEGAALSRESGELARLGYERSHRGRVQSSMSSRLEQRLAREESDADKAMARIKQLTAGI
jgi:hypothetical protein